MGTLGYASLLDKALPSLWDLAEIKKVALADGTTFDQVVRDLQTGLGVVNGMLLTMPHYGDLLSVQDSVEVEYAVGVSNGIQEASEWSPPDPRRGATTGHSLPLKKYDRALGWSMMYLRDARRAKLDADVSSAMQDIRDGWQKHLLTRLFKSTAEAVGATSGASVPFADGGTADSTYVPLTSPTGKTFTSGHNHYKRQSALDMTNLPANVLELQEHGHQSPFDAIGSEADAATWAGLSGWKNPEWAGIMYHSTASGSDRAAFGDIGNYYGLVETIYGVVRVWLSPRVPTGWYGLFKTYGPGDPRNPLRLRINPNFGFGWQVVPGTWVNAPALMAVLYTEYGFGIGDRTNGVMVKVSGSGSYTDPTIS